MTSGDGERIALARGIIAIGDAAIGVIAVGGFAFGGLTVAGISVGLVSISGLSVGLLFALGAFAAGGVSFGFVTNAPAPDSPTGFSLLSLLPETVESVSLFAWGFGTLVVTAAAAAVILAFTRDPPKPVD